jgi:hypothetical protein
MYDTKSETGAVRGADLCFIPGPCGFQSQAVGKVKIVKFIEVTLGA